jgi:hypothetical protein
MIDPSARWPSGRRKWPVWCKDVYSGVWTRLAVYQPDYPPYGFIRQHTAVAADQKRVYVSVDVGGGTAAYWYIDFTNGIAGASISKLLMPTTAVGPNRRTTGAFTAGHPDGRHLWYWPDLGNSSGLIVQDLDAGTQARLSVGQGLNISTTDGPGMQYDATGNRILILQDHGNGVLKYRWISIPADPLNTAGYIVSAERTLATGSSVAQPVLPTFLYGKAHFHSQLGVMFVPQDRAPMLAFRPAA